MIKQFNDMFRKNKIQKFSALVMSIALWFFVMGSQDPPTTRSYTVPVEVINSPRDIKAIVEQEPIKIKLSAPRSYFADYTDSDIHATIDVANLTEGDYDLPIGAAFPKGFDLVHISPDKLHVKIEPFVDKQFAAEIIVTGSTISDVVCH